MATQIYIIQTDDCIAAIYSTQKGAVERARREHAHDGYKYSVWVSAMEVDDPEGKVQEIGMFRRKNGPRTESPWIPHEHEDWVPIA